VNGECSEVDRTRVEERRADVPHIPTSVGLLLRGYSKRQRIRQKVGRSLFFGESEQPISSRTDESSYGDSRRAT
jgi:hypothetical protein